MTDRGIIFSAPMVLALLAGTKTQTRRLATSPLRRCQIGDRLWVRETTRFWSAGHDAEITYLADVSARQTGPNTGEIPDASLAAYFKRVDQAVRLSRGFGIPSIHLPRWASRLTLIVTDVRREPLQAISASDCYAEGIERPTGPFMGSEVCARDNARGAFRKLWDGLHDVDGQRWDDNPDLVALTFDVRPGNIDRLEP